MSIEGTLISRERIRLHRRESRVEAICRLLVVIDDGTATITTTICSPDAEKLMPFDAIQLMEAADNGDLHNEIAKSVNQHTVVAFLRSYESTHYGQPKMNTCVVKCYKLDEPLPPPHLIDIQSERETSSSTLDVVHQLVTNKAKDKLFDPHTPSKTTKRSLPMAAKVPISKDDLHCKKDDTKSTTKISPLSIEKESVATAVGGYESPTKKTKESSK